MSRVIMVRMKNRARFFTEEANLDMLQEFAKTFNAELSLVEANEPYLIPVDRLASVVCEPAAMESGPKRRITMVKRIYPEARRERSELLRNATAIRGFIRSRLLEGEQVSLKGLKKRFDSMSLTDSCLCNHLSAVRKEIKLMGYGVVKKGAGAYALTKTA